jgi:flagellar motor switch protein FliM
MAAVIEQMTTGRVVPSKAEPRVATRTDAVIVATIFDRILEVFDEGLAQMPEAPPVSGYRQSVALDDGRAVAMALEDMPYRQYRLSLDFGRGAKSGELRLIFPYDSTGQDGAVALMDAQWRKGWHAAVMQTQALVEAVLHRFTIPLDEIGSLDVGSIIPIPLAAVAQVSLEGGDGQCVATGKLGQCNGHRAVRVAAGPVGEGVPRSVLSAQDFVIAGVADVAILATDAGAANAGSGDVPEDKGSDMGGAGQPGDAQMAEIGTVA